MCLKGASRVALLVLCGARIATAQQWNDARVRDLVQLATDRRAQQLADTGLTDYQAKAHGYVTFLAQLGEGFREPPQIVKADELELEVYWRSPNLSKQFIVGRRDTTLLPTDIQYHRDHLGIVQNNFPAIIRIGEGDEVRDVPHPLSADGLTQYDFALTDSLRITIPGRVINVYEVKVRPTDDRQPRLIGAMYLERETGQVVRMAFSFTRAAYLDKQLEDLFVVLENGLVGTRFWLPLRQEVEIRRTATWMDYPARGIIRGRWEIREYKLNTGLPGIAFAGPEITGGRANPEFAWPSAHILDSLPPDVRVVSAQEIRRVQAEARALVRSQALRRGRSTAFSASGLSDIVRFDRAEGTALGGGVSARIGAGFGVAARARYGTADDAIKGGASIGWRAPKGQTLRAYADRDYADASDVPERSLLVNSIAAQEFASDYTDPYEVRRVGASVAGVMRGMLWSVDADVEKHAPLAIRAIPASGRFPLLVPADSLTGRRLSITLERPTSLWIGGIELRASGMAHALRRDDQSTTFRAAGDIELQRPVGSHRVVGRTILAAVGSAAAVPAQELVYFGGTITAPGYAYHSLAGSAAASQRLELQTPLPVPSLSLGRFGHSPARITFAPFVSAVVLRAPDSTRVSSRGALEARDRLFRRASATYPSAGVGLLFFFDVLRVDVARGLRDERWMFSIDAHRSFWGVL